MKVGALRQRAADVGVPAEQIEGARDGDDPKGELIALITAAALSAMDVNTVDVGADVGVHAEEIEDTRDGDDPRGELIELIIPDHPQPTVPLRDSTPPLTQNTMATADLKSTNVGALRQRAESMGVPGQNPSVKTATNQRRKWLAVGGTAALLILGIIIVLASSSSSGSPGSLAPAPTPAALVCATGANTVGPASACLNGSMSGMTTLAACKTDWLNSDGVALNGCEAPVCYNGYNGTYCSDMVGTCVGPGGSTDYVNGKVNCPFTRAACRAGCDAAPACTGYSYRAVNAACCVHGPGLDTDLAGGWSAHTYPTTTIAGADGNSDVVCAAVAGRN